MNKFKTFDELAKDTKEKLMFFHNYPAKTLSRYDGIVKIIGNVMHKHDIVYSFECATNWLKNYIDDNGYSDFTYRRYRRIIMLLNDNFNDDLDEWKIYPRNKRLVPFSDDFISLCEDYQKFMYSANYSERTIYCRMHDIHYFLSYLESIGIFDIKEVSHLTVSNYLTSVHFQNRKQEGVSTEISGLRKFISYLEDKKIIDYDNLHFACMMARNRSRRIITVYNSKQIDTITNTFGDFPSCLRNRAVYTLALKCGLRTCDIMNLRFEDIDFEKKEIQIIQQKTKIPLVIPFDNSVSNALIDYILTERRVCNNPYVFITAVGPVRKLSHNTSFRTQRRFNKTDECQPPAQFGLHILRRTYASKLLEAGAEISAIASALGHINTQTVDRYLSTDEKRMKLCSLSIEKFPYNGGLF